MKRAILAALIAGALMLTGCNPVSTYTGDDRVEAKYVDLPDGGRVLCVMWIYSAPAISCDWRER